MRFEFELSEFINFRDQEACKRVRAINKEEITDHPNDQFKIRVIEKPANWGGLLRWNCRD